MIRFSFRWFCSRKIRMAVQMRHQVQKYLNAQRDLLSAEAVEHLETAISDSTRVINHGAIPKEVEAGMTQLEDVANKWLKPYRNAGIRENVEVGIVAAAVVLGFRSFFFQPMAIPSGSAQPTFYGITEENLRGKPDAVIPSGLKKWYLSWVKGKKYYVSKAESSGVFEIVDREPVRLFPMVSKQRYKIGNEVHTVWFPPDSLWNRAKMRPGMRFNEGDDVIKLRVTSGDHLFVNRLIYNFKRPERGETIVFKSTGVPGLTQHTHYIKRLVALGGETVSIGDDRHVRIDGAPLDASDPGFEFVYTFDGPPKDSVYSGHVNNFIGRKYSPNNLALLFPDENARYTIRPNHYFTLGDNTMNSHDSRNWGDFPREKVIGKSFFVFWPISDRFGWHAR